MIKKTIASIFLLSYCITFGYSQIGGSSTYSSLNLPNSARISAMGGTPLSIKDDDLCLSLANPSLLTAKMNHKLALSFVSYFAGVNYGFAAYAHNFRKFGIVNSAIQYVNYGSFIEADETGTQTGEFHANDIAITEGWAKPLDSAFDIGANIKAIYSTMYNYYSFGLAVDIGATYHNNKHGIALSILACNLGREIKPYRDGNKESIPFEIQLAASKKLEHVPLRISLVAQHLEKFDLTYSDPNNPAPTTDPLTGELLPPKKFSKFTDKVLRHFVIGGEFLPGKNFALRFGYNYMRRKEMVVDSKLSTVGFSWGFGIRVSKFYLSYARNRYHLVGSPNTITICTNISDFLSKDK